MTRPETLVIVDRGGTLQIEIRELLREGDKAYLLFGRSDGTVARVEIDPTKLYETVECRVPVDLAYRGGAPSDDIAGRLVNDLAEIGVFATVATT